ncbi:MAG: hypothetical protein SGJ21_06975, partial [Alphaproteobacteria bacterium]|nr:hypothetical protein [Alphaproteobacteria bacterium]
MSGRLRAQARRNVIDLRRFDRATRDGLCSAIRFTTIPHRTGEMGGVAMRFRLSSGVLPMVLAKPKLVALAIGVAVLAAGGVAFTAMQKPEDAASASPAASRGGASAGGAGAPRG